MSPHLSIPKAELASFCRMHDIRWLAIFGSALRADFGPNSDIDVLVEFIEGRSPGLLGIAGLEIELSALFGGRNVDLRTPQDLSRHFRQDVLDKTVVQYAHG